MGIISNIHIGIHLNNEDQITIAKYIHNNLNNKDKITIAKHGLHDYMQKDNNDFDEHDKYELFRGCSIGDFQVNMSLPLSDLLPSEGISRHSILDRKANLLTEKSSADGLWFLIIP